MNKSNETKGALAAMNRAALIARERAARFGSRLVLWKDGAVVIIDPRTIKTEANLKDFDRLLARVPDCEPDAGDELTPRNRRRKSSPS